MTRAYRFLSLALLLEVFASLAGVTSAQSPPTTGTPPFGSFGGGPEVINMANNNVHWDVPVFARSGRGGFNFTYDLNYDGAVWAGGVSSGSSLWYPVGNWGWRGVTEASMGYLSYTSSMHLSCQIWNPDDRRWDKYFYYLYNFSGYGDPFGIPHPLNVTLEDDETGGNCPNNPPPNIPSYATGTISDGSGYGYSLQAPASSGFEYIYPTSGGAIKPPLSRFAVAANNTDRNGNQITVNSSGQFFDTLNSTTPVLAVTGSNPMTFSYTAPSGANAQYTMKYTAYTVKTNFGCPNISEYGPTSNNLVSEVDLPDWNATTNPSSRYTFTYEATPGYPGDVTGRLASVILPTGGTISYTYSGGNNGIVCADGSTAILTRTTPDGTWTYAHSESGTAWTTLVTDPQGNQTSLNFQGIYETQRQIYSGLQSGGNLLRQWTTCYNGNTSNCNGTAVTLPITQRTVTDQYGTNGLQSQHNYFYNSAGAPTEQDDYDYGSGSHGSLLRQILYSYSSLGNNITAFRQAVTIKDGSGNIKAQTNYNYDETTPTATSGIAQHTTVSGSRGNLTSINYPVSGLTSHLTYYDTGSLNTSQDINGATTTYNYSNNTADCQMGFPTSISEPLGMSRSMAWNCTGGVATSITDENNQTVTTNYNDPYFWRPASITDQISAVRNFCFAALSAGTCPATPTSTQVEPYMNFNSGNSTSDRLLTLDGLGRIHVQQTRQSPSSTNFVSTETDYDALGRTTRTTVPYIGTAGQTNSGAGAVTTAYDPLSRVSSTSDSGGGSTTYTYNQNDVLVTVGPAPAGENTKRRQFEYDALGRLTSVCEVTTLPGSGTCGQNNPLTGYWTKYSYDALGNLLSVTQNAQASGGSQQTRTFSYDAMGRLTSETNPESGTRSYVYDTDSTMCGNGTYTSYGDLLKTTDANGNCVMRYYDQRHRLTDVGNSTQSVSHCKRFRYDNSSGYPGSTKPSGLANTMGRLIEAATDFCSGGNDSIITDEWFSYTVRGETSDVYESTPHSGTYYHVNQTYWPNGAPNVLSGNIGLPASITYGVDGEGRTSTTSASSGQSPVTSASYNMYVSPYQLTVGFGSGDLDVFTFDPNTMRMNQYQFRIGTQTVTGTLGWNANSSLGSLNISDPFSTANTQNCSFVADDLARVASVNCGAIWSQNFAYDPFGNITKTGTSSFAPTYASSPTTNRIASVNGVSASYDSNGNSLNDTFRTYAWNAFNDPISMGAVSLTYDALDRMVEQSVSGTNTQIVYSPAGTKLALMNGTSLTKGFVRVAGGATAVYNSSGLAYYRHADHLGSSRFASTPSGTLYADYAYAPFGEPYASSGAIDPSFTGQNQDTTAGLYDFLFREYDPNQSRWTQPDPAGLAAIAPSNPQSWNRYAYVINSPLTSIDAMGLINPCLYTVQNGEPSAPNQQQDSKGGGPFALAEDSDVAEADPQHIPTAGCGGGGGGGSDGYFIDGSYMSWDLGGGFSSSGLLGGTVECPNDVCSGVGTDANGNTQFVQFMAFAGGVSGYFDPNVIGQGVWEWGGQLYTASGWATYLGNQQELAREALADAISLASDSPDGSNWDQIYDHLAYDTTKGGNADFKWVTTLDDGSALALGQLQLSIPGLDSGGCEWSCRAGSVPSLHFNDDMFHLDTANPSWGFGLGLFIHGFVDVLLGNVNPSVPMVHH